MKIHDHQGASWKVLYGFYSIHFNCVGWEITFFNFLLSIKWKWEKSPLFQIILQKYSITLEFMDNNKTLDIRDNIQQSKSQ